MEGGLWHSPKISSKKIKGLLHRVEMEVFSLFDSPRLVNAVITYFGAVNCRPSRC
jgi:hypothetical protein